MNDYRPPRIIHNWMFLCVCVFNTAQEESRAHQDGMQQLYGRCWGQEGEVAEGLPQLREGVQGHLRHHSHHV